MSHVKKYLLDEKVQLSIIIKTKLKVNEKNAYHNKLSSLPLLLLTGMAGRMPEKVAAATDGEFSARLSSLDWWLVCRSFSTSSALHRCSRRLS